MKKPLEIGDGGIRNRSLEEIIGTIQYSEEEKRTQVNVCMAEVKYICC